MEILHVIWMMILHMPYENYSSTLVHRVPKTFAAAPCREYDGFIPATPEQQTRMIKKHGCLLIIKCVSVLTIKLTSSNVGAYASDRD